MKSILDPSFRYTPSFNTDLQKTFARIRREVRRDGDRVAEVSPVVSSKVTSIVPKAAQRRS
jgi:hypothetical protein